MNKKQIIKLIAFPILLVGCILSLEFFLFRKVSDDLTSYSQFYKENENALDVVLIGNSTLREGYVPTTMWKEEGIMSRGLSSSPTHPEVIKVAIKEVIEKQHPEIIFIDVNGLTFQKREYSQRFIEQYYKALPKGKHKDELLEMYPYLKKDDDSFELFKNHNNLRQQQYWESLVYPDQFKTKGYQPNKIKQSVSRVDIPTDSISLNEDGEYYFNELVSECEKYQDQVTFVFGKMPKVNDVAGEAEFIKSEQMFNTIEERLKDTNIKYKNFTRYIDEIGLDNTKDFKDKDHLNHLGALKFTRYFAKYLKDELHISIKEKTKDAISSFDECYEKTKDYLESIERKLK